MIFCSNPQLWHRAASSSLYIEEKQDLQYSDESFYAASAGWQEQQTDAVLQQNKGSFDIFRTPSLGSDILDGDDELEMPSTQGSSQPSIHSSLRRFVYISLDVADALDYGEPDAEEEILEGVDEVSALGSQFRENLVGFTPGFYHSPYSATVV